MNITEIRTKLVNDPSERLRAYCSITIDGDFVIRDLKIIDGPNGPFLAMPSRKLADRCQKCGAKNHLRARFCNECGARLPENRAPRDGMGRSKLHADVAHPINAACRERIQKAVVDAFLEEVDASHLPGYKPADYDEYDDENEFERESDSIDETDEIEEEAVAVDESANDNDDGFGAGLDQAEAAPARRGSSRREGSTDYDSLIADLKREAADRRGDGGGGRDRDRRNDRRADRAETARQGGRSESSGRPRSNDDRGRHGDGGGGRHGSRGRRGDRRDDRPREQEARPTHAPAAESPKPKPVSPPPPPPKPEPADDNTADDFGAGIL